MAEPFKNLFNREIIETMAGHLARVSADFDPAGFITMATDNLEALELKARSDQITKALVSFLPKDFETAAAIMLASLARDDASGFGSTGTDETGISGWATMPMNTYVGLYGKNYFDVSMELFKALTKRGSSEFGIRFFLLEEPQKTLALLQKWTSDPNQHVRRLVSEGTRPRLPWAMRLPAFIADPAPLLPLLEALKDDDEEYVRRSVANNLNDIAKDHPDLVADIAGLWLKNASKNRQRLVRHACRSLIKQGPQKTLRALSYRPPALTLEKLEILTPRVTFGDALEFELSLASTSDQEQPLILDFIIHHQKANGRTSPKVFKWKMLTLGPRAKLNANKKHPIRKITTRVYYPGTHRLEILANGVPIKSLDFELVM